MTNYYGAASPRKRLRRFSICAASASAVVLLAACGSSSKSASGGSTGKLPNPIVIGATLPLTGAGGAYGTIMRDGMQVAVDQINSTGGIDGSQVKFIPLDDQAQAGPAVSETKQLIQDGAVAIATAFTAPPLAQLPDAERAKVPLFNGGGNDPKLLDNAWLYNDVLMVNQEAKADMQYVHDHMGVKTMGIISETDYTPTAINAVNQAWQAVSGNAPISATIDQTATDATPQLDKILAAHPDAIYVACDGNIATLVLKQLAELHVTIPVLSYSAALALGSVVFQSPIANQFVFTSQDYQPGAQFTQLFKAKFPGQTPDLYNANYYNFPLLVKQALEYAVAHKLGTGGAAIKAAIAQMGQIQGCCGAYSFNSHNGFNGQVDIIKIQNGTTKTLATVSAPAA